jgi:murein DD-endopeptidase MepM/ murein hydrolase activator NlpD
MGEYGRLLVLRSRGGEVEGLRGTLSKDYNGYAAGSTMIASHAEASARNGVAPPPPKPKPKPPKRAPQQPAKARTQPSKPPKAAKPPHRKGPTRKEVLATDKHFVFPVYGKHFLADGFTGAGTGQLKPGCTGPHAGDDIFAAGGTPILAVADGTLQQVGTLPCSGNRVWLRSTRGDRFFYAHLESFASITQNGAKVKAGQVIGFLGNTGQAVDRPSHLHFEIHPAGGLAVDPYPFLRAWESHRDVPAAAWVRRYSAEVGQQPGTLVVLKDFLSR